MVKIHFDYGTVLILDRDYRHNTNLFVVDLELDKFVNRFLNGITLEEVEIVRNLVDINLKSRLERMKLLG